MTFPVTIAHPNEGGVVSLACGHHWLAFFGVGWIIREETKLGGTM